MGKDGAAPTAPIPAPVPGVDEIAFDADRYQRMTVPVSIGGAGPYRFLVDTGAQASVVTPRVRDEAMLTRDGKAQIVAMSSSALVDTYRLDGLQFAGRTQDALTVALLQARHIGADGILGLDALQSMRVLIDFREGRITLAEAGSLEGTRGYEIVVRARRKLGQMVITDARIDGVRTAVVIDTGAQTSYGNAALRRKLRLRGSSDLLSTDVNGVEAVSSLGFARKMQLGPLTLSGVPIAYGDSPVFASLELADRPALILGMQNLRLFDRIAIDFARRRVMFDLPRSVTGAEARDRVFDPRRSSF